MIDRIKWYLIEVVAPKYIPVAILAALSALGTFMVAHADVLEKYGITYGIWPLNWPVAPTGPVIVIELDTLSKAAVAALVALLGIVIVAIQHHVTGTPIVVGGKRETDPPAVTPKAV